jgi:hypothetical protein
MIPRRRPTSAYRLREHAPVATVCRLWRAFAASGKVGRAIVALIVLALLASTLDGNIELARERDRADRAEASAAATAAYASGNVLSISLTGRREQVANWAGRIASIAP